jgi:hypothetical protein
MKAIQPIKVIETRREPPMWAVKIDSRYAAEFVGEGAKSCAIAWFCAVRLLTLILPVSTQWLGRNSPPTCVKFQKSKSPFLSHNSALKFPLSHSRGLVSRHCQIFCGLSGYFLGNLSYDFSAVIIGERDRAAWAKILREDRQCFVGWRFCGNRSKSFDALSEISANPNSLSGGNALGSGN